MTDITAFIAKIVASRKEEIFFCPRNFVVNTSDNTNKAMVITIIIITPFLFKIFT